MNTEDIKAIALSIAATAIFEFLRWVLSKTDKTAPKEKGEQYIRKVKKEFYVSVIVTIILILLPYSKYEFIRIAKKVLSVLSIMFSVMAFMCLDDERKALNDKLSDHPTDSTIKNDSVIK